MRLLLALCCCFCWVGVQCDESLSATTATKLPPPETNNNVHKSLPLLLRETMLEVVGGDERELEKVVHGHDGHNSKLDGADATLEGGESSGGHAAVIPPGGGVAAEHVVAPQEVVQQQRKRIEMRVDPSLAHRKPRRSKKHNKLRGSTADADSSSTSTSSDSAGDADGVASITINGAVANQQIGSPNTIPIAKFCFDPLDKTQEPLVISYWAVPPVTSTQLLVDWKDPSQWSQGVLAQFPLTNTSAIVDLSGDVDTMWIGVLMSDIATVNFTFDMDHAVGGCVLSPFGTPDDLCAESTSETCRRETDALGDIDRIEGTATFGSDGWAFLGKACFPAGQSLFPLEMMGVLTYSDNTTASDSDPDTTVLLVYFEDDWLDAQLYTGDCASRPVTWSLSFDLQNQTFSVSTEGQELILYFAISNCNLMAKSYDFHLAVEGGYVCGNSLFSPFEEQCLATAGFECQTRSRGQPDGGEIFTTYTGVNASALILALSFGLYTALLAAFFIVKFVRKD